MNMKFRIINVSTRKLVGIAFNEAEAVDRLAGLRRKQPLKAFAYQPYGETESVLDVAPSNRDVHLKLQLA
jgi:hypothetical protein